MKRTEAVSVGQIIDQAIAATGGRDSFMGQRALFIWTEIVGPAINRQTTRRWIDRDVLHVCIASGVLKSELAYCSQSLVEKINRAVGENVISKIVIH